MVTIRNVKNLSGDYLQDRAAKHDMVPRPFVITKLNWETGAGDIFTWALDPLDGVPLEFLPGQFNMLYTHGQGEVPISISADSESGPLLHTTRAVGGVTSAMARLSVGSSVGVRGPFGSAWPLAEVRGKDVVIIAGGLGLPPLRPVIYSILRHREKFGRVHLLYGARTPKDIVFRDELEAWHHNRQINVLTTVDRAEGQWLGHVGVVPQLLTGLDIDTNNVCVMMCGPEVMMHFTQLALHKLGVMDDCIYLSMERNMKCAIGHCGHCQWGPHFICKDGPIFRFDRVKDLFAIAHL